MLVFKDFDFSSMNTFRMKVKVACCVFFDSMDEIVSFIDDQRRKAANGEETSPKPYLCVGGGSNLLFMGDFVGTVLHSRILGTDVVDDDGTSVLVKVGSGLSWDAFCSWCAERGLWGPENLSLIPGDVGAAVVQNIGAYGREAGDLVNLVECLDLENGEVCTFRPSECAFGYRTSMFKTTGKGRYVVLSVLFSLTRELSPSLGHRSLREVIEKKYETERLYPQIVRDEIIAIRRQKLPEPSEVGSAGSYFKNPVISEDQLAHVREVAENEGFGDVPCYPSEVSGSWKVPAAWLIEHCGWKGWKEGNVGVWDKQPLVIVNLTGEASPDEVVTLENKVKTSVLSRFGIGLEPEVEHIG